MNDADLLARFATEHCEASFAALVRRHTPLVLGCASRLLRGDHQLAKDVAQVVFSILARKAKRLRNHPSISGWLYKATYQQASRVAAKESRRSRREQTYAAESSHGHTGSQADRPLVHEQLDHALTELRPSDREILLWRFFEDRSYEEIAANLAISEVAARKRTSRALAQLGNNLRNRGLAIAPSAALLLVVATQENVARAAAGLAPVAIQSNQSISTLAKTLIIMEGSRLKGGVLVALIALIPLTLQWRENQQLRAALNTQSSKIPSFPQSQSRSDPTSDVVDLRRALAKALEERQLAEARLEALEDTLGPLREEVLVSYGRIEEIGQSFGGILETSVEARRLLSKPENELTSEEALARADYLHQHTELMGVLPEISRMQETPEEFARLMQTALQHAANLDGNAVAGLEDFILRRSQEKLKEGLIPNLRPEDNQDDWDQRRRAFNEETVSGLLERLPESASATMHLLDAFEIIDLRSPR